MSVVLSLGSATRYNRYLLLETMGKHSAIDRPMSAARAVPCHHGRLAGHLLLRFPIPFLHAVVWRGSTGAGRARSAQCAGGPTVRCHRRARRKETSPRPTLSTAP